MYSSHYNHTALTNSPRTNTPSKMFRLSAYLALALVGLSSALPVAQQTAAGGTEGQGDQRFFGNLLGAVQGAWQGLTRPELYNDNFGFGYPLNTNNFGGGGFGGGYNQGGWNGGYGGGYNRGFEYGYNQWG